MQISRRGLMLASAGLLVAPSAWGQDAALVEAAKREGKVVWYTTVGVAQLVRPMVAAFEKKYGVKVETATGGSSELATRIVNEGRAGKVAADLWDGSTTFATIDAANFAEAYPPKGAADYPADLRDAAGRWTAQSIQFYGPAVNTSMVAEKDRPKTLDDLLDPRWKGQIAWNAEAGLTSPIAFIGTLIRRMGNDNAMAYLRRLSAQKIANLPGGNRVVMDKTIAGEYAIVMFAGNQQVEASRAAGAPIQFLKIAPAMNVVSRIGIVKGGPNPNAARLLIEFIVGEDGQTVYREAGYVPAHPKIPALIPDLRPDTGKFEASTLSLEDYVVGQAAWSAVFKELFE